MTSRRARERANARPWETPEHTGWPPGMLQDDCRGLSIWLASKPDARRLAREAAAAIQEPVYSREWFAKKASEAKDRIDREWSDSMKANSVYAAATLPCVGHAYQPDDDQATGDASDGCGDWDEGDEDE